MAETVMCPEQIVFGLDIGTRSIVGTVGYMDNNGFHVVAMEVKEHDTRAMIDGQVHDIGAVSDEISQVKERLETKLGRKLSKVCIAAAGRVLRTLTVHATTEIDEEVKISSEHIYNLDVTGVELAHRQISNSEDGINYYCVGYTPVKYYLNDYEIGNLEGHKGRSISVDLLATFLPEEVVDGLYASVEGAGLEVDNLTLEPIAAMNVAIPEQYRLLNIALVDVGAGTSDICITKDGSIIAYGMIPSAGDEISELIAKKYLVDFKQAEKIKIAAGGKRAINFKDIMGIKSSLLPEEIIEATAPVTNRITKEVADKIVELNVGKPVSAVFVVGGGGKIPGFTKTLAKELGLMESRVALRGKEVLSDIEFAISNIKKDPLYVTPIGICINYYNQKNNFISVTVNGSKIKLYDNNKLSVIDAVMQSGYPNELLFPRRGRAVNYSFNGEARMIRGTMGEPAIIYKNGKESNMNAPIEKNDFIDITESSVGESLNTSISQLPEFKSSVIIFVNGSKIICPRFAYVNGEIQSGNYVINDGDSITMENFYTVKQLFEFIDVPVNEVSIQVNNEAADYNTKVYENFNVKYSYLEHEETKISEEPPIDNEVSATETAVKADTAKDDTSAVVFINGSTVVLTGKKAYTFVDVFDFYPFDLTKAGGTELITNINGIKADFTDTLKEGDTVDLYWK